MIKKWITLVIVGIAIIAPVQANQSQITMEQHLTQKAQTALDGIYGKGHFIVRIKANMYPAKYEVKYTKQSTPKLRKVKKKDTINILPGYPVIKNLSPSNLHNLPFDSVTNYIPPKVRSLKINIIVNKVVPRAISARAEELVREVLSLGSNDTIELSRKRFLKDEEKPAIETKTFFQELLEPLNILLLIGILTIIGIATIYLFLQYQPIRQIKTRKKEKEENALTNNVSVNPNMELPKVQDNNNTDISITGEPKIKKYFDFITEENLPNLIHLLKKEQVAIEHVSLILAYMKPCLAPEILKSYSIKEQSQIASNILDEKLINRAFIEKLERKVRGWLECFVGGESQFKRIFENISSEIKKKIMNTLSKTDANAFRKFRAHVLIFDDLRFLDDKELQIVLSDANMELLSQALVTVDEKTYKKIDNNLTQEAKSMIKQYLDLKGQNLSKEHIENAQEYILKIVEKLEMEEKINLRNKIKG